MNHHKILMSTCTICTLTTNNIQFQIYVSNTFIKFKYLCQQLTSKMSTINNMNLAETTDHKRLISRRNRDTQTEGEKMLQKRGIATGARRTPRSWSLARWLVYNRLHSWRGRGLPSAHSLGPLTFFRTKVDVSRGRVIQLIPEQPLQINDGRRVVPEGSLLPLDNLLQPGDFVFVGGGVGPYVSGTRR
ncbi:uncharacterized protein LOC134237620 [Saccostrea cucullata]|uniref:uncharacterized protein LOC134237620 n=1 Tax=Saccostrea cuccullata TaxID=36930 RepID=UPI002ED24E64